MAAMLTALTEFADNGNSRTYTYSGHTALTPRLVIQKRRVPVGSQVICETSINVIRSANDADGATLPEKISFMAVVRYPVTGLVSQIQAARDTFRDIVAGDEFASSVETQNFLS